MKPRLNNVRNPQGRADVLVYRLAERWIEHFEAGRPELAGLREYFLPLVERAIAARIPAGNVIPEELRGLMAAFENQFGGRRC